VDASAFPERSRYDLLRYLLATSAERAAILGELFERNPAMAEVLADLEADDELRLRFELALVADRA
jgi:hypothetical protein